MQNIGHKIESPPNSQDVFKGIIGAISLEKSVTLGIEGQKIIKVTIDKLASHQSENGSRQTIAEGIARVIDKGLNPAKQSRVTIQSHSDKSQPATIFFEDNN